MLRRTLLKSKTPLRQTKPLNPISKRKIDQINGEYANRIKLCLRCGGMPHIETRMIRLNNRQRFQLRSVTCIGGYCEICHKPTGNSILHPHEKNPRGKGGKLSLENSIMCHNEPCHRLAQQHKLLI